jgi:WD40 repeat protein
MSAREPAEHTTQTYPAEESLPTAPPGAPPAPDGPASWPAVPGYEVVGVLGRGGMGVVYQARQTSLGRLVALKMIRDASLADGESVARFRAEAAAAAQLQHPNIVQVYEIGDHRGLPYFSLEYVAGGSLAARLGGEPQPPRSAAQLVETLARAVGAAHQRGVVHRDLKPANVLLAADSTSPGATSPALHGPQSTDYGLPKVTDFGLAKRLDDDSGQTRSGTVMGTPSYMAPEQAWGKVRELGPPVDIYALGAILYEALTGRPPFRGATQVETLDQVRSQEPVPAVRLQPRLPPDLDTICLKCLHKDPAKRYASAAALADDLRRFLDGLPIHARPAGLLERVVRWARRRPAAAALLVVTGLAMAVVLIGGLVYDARLQRAIRDVDTKSTALDEAGKQIEGLQGRARETLSEAQANLYVSNIAAAREQLAVGDVTRTEELLNACPPELRRWEWHHLRRSYQDDLLTFQANHQGEAVNYLAFTADGHTLATATANLMVQNRSGEVVLWDSATGDRQLCRVPPPVFAFLGAPALPVFTALAGLGQTPFGAALAFSDHSGPVEEVALSPDGEYLASASSRVDMLGLLLGTVRPDAPARGEVILRQARTGRVVARLPGYRAVVFSPDGRRLAAAGLDRAVHVWETTTGREVLATQPLHKGRVGSVAWSGDGRWLASVDFRVTRADKGRVRVESEIRLWDVASGRLQRTLPGYTEGTDVVRFSPDGRRLASGDRDWMVRVWEVPTGRLLQTLRGHRGEVLTLAFSPDGRWLASGGKDRAVRVWDPESGEELSSFRGHADDVRSVAFVPGSGQSPRLASAGGDGLVKLWDPVATGGARRFRGGHVSAMSSTALSPDGSVLATSGADSRLVLWDVATARVLRRLACKPSHLAFSPDGRLLATGGGTPTAFDQPGELKVWDVATGRELYALRGHTKLITGLAFSPDARRLASCSGNTYQEKPGEVKVWEFTGRQPREVCSFSPAGRCIDGIAWSPDGKRLALAAMSKVQPVVFLSDPDTGEILRTLTGHLDPVVAVAFSVDGRLASGSQDGFVLIWDPESGRELLQFRAHPSPRGHTSVLAGIAFSPDGERLATTNFDIPDGHGELKLWESRRATELLTLPGHLAISFSRDGRRLASVRARSLLGPGEAIVWDATPGPDLFTLRAGAGIVFGVAAAPDGRTLASAHADRTVILWDPDTGRPRRTLRGHTDGVSHVAFDTDGWRIATCGFDGTVRLWHAKTGAELFTARGHRGSVWAVAFSPDGGLLASAGADGTIRLWDTTAAGQEVGQLAGHTGIVWDLAFHPAGILMASASGDGTIRLWDVRSRQVVRVITGHHGPVRSVAFSRDGYQLASAGMDSTIRIWEPVGGKELRTLRGHRGPVRRVAFSPDGGLLASAGFDRTARLWDLRTGQPPRVLSGHVSLVNGLAFTPDGQFLVTGSYDQTVKVWRVAPPPTAAD